jgi:hypothetical protein
LLHDNGRSRKHRDVINYLTVEGIMIMSHPPYSLDDYIKKKLTDQTNEESLARAASEMVKNIPEKVLKNFWQTVRKNGTLYK